MDCLHFPEVPSINCTRTEWAYAMRREMQEILPNLFLGPYAAATRSKLDALLRCGITHVVCIRQAVEANIIRPNFPDTFRYLVIEIADSVTENIICHFPRVRDFLDECLRSDGRVLVHGNAGISRSAALVIAYIMEKYGMSYEKAFQYVQERRFCVCPNEGFAQQLMEYEPIYKARMSLENGQPSQQKGVLKRKHMEDESEDMDLSGFS